MHWTAWKSRIVCKSFIIMNYCARPTAVEYRRQKFVKDDLFCVNAEPF